MQLIVELFFTEKYWQRGLPTI